MPLFQNVQRDGNKSGTLRLPEIRTLPLEEATTALAESEAGHVRGKLVLTVSPELT